LTDSVFASFGGLELPVSEQDVSSSLSSFDPARDRLLRWFRLAINSEFAFPWTEATDALPAGHALIGTQPVQDSIPFAPTQSVMGTRKAAWPLLALHREGDAEISDFSLEEDQLKQRWQLHHILGPLDIEAGRRVLDIGQAIGKFLALTIRRFGHQSVDDGANQQELAGLMSLRIVSISGPGPASFDSDGETAVFWATRYTLETVETSDDVTEHYAEFEGANISIDVGGAGSDEVNPNFVEADFPVDMRDRFSPISSIFDETFDYRFL
jgi:hypothetical protein